MKRTTKKRTGKRKGLGSVTTTSSKKGGYGPLLVGAIALGGIAAYMKAKADGGTGIQFDPITPAAPQGDTPFPLSYGAKGKNVRSVQVALIALGGQPKNLIVQSGGVDGIFGDGTLAAIKAAGYSVPFTQANYLKLSSGIATVKPIVSLGPDTSQVGKYLFISSSKGGKIYKNVLGKNATGVPSGEIINLPHKVMVGTYVDEFGNYRKAKTNIKTAANGSQTFTFWVHKDDVTYVNTLNDIFKFGGRLKTDEEATTILRALS